MRKIYQALVIILLITFLIPVKAKAETRVSINELIEKAKEYDGKTVTIQGETIGESMNRGDFTWINVNDTTNAIGIWLSKSDASKVTYYGNYHNTGDMVEITAVFHRACREHGGEADLHGSTINIVKEGHKAGEVISPIKGICMGALGIIALGMSLQFIIMRRNKLIKHEM
jgi:hypothetical protein